MSGQLWAKSPRPGRAEGELLTTHLAEALAAMDGLRLRVGQVAKLPDRFWIWARLAILLHDAGKVADGFQVMVGNGGRPAEGWGERHEIFSLGFVARVLAGMSPDDRLWVATGVATHHRPFTGEGENGRPPLFTSYRLGPAAFVARFGTADPDSIAALQQWLIDTARQHDLLTEASGPVPGGEGLGQDAEGLGQDAHELFAELRERWETRLRAQKRPDGLIAVLLQGAVTLADHLSSAHGQLCTDHPLTSGYPEWLRAHLRGQGNELRPHQVRAGTVDGHLLLRAPTGSGKTEAALLWALAQIDILRRRTGGNPRLFYTLPYLASINAMADRLGRDLQTPDIGVAHSRAASYHLAQALRDDCVSPPAEQGAVADKAVSRAAATKLFRELVRVGTPYQLLRGALAGPAHSGILIDAANSVFVLDELHAYDPRRLGMILAMLRFWEDLGGRIAVLSATLPDALATLLDGTLAVPCERVELAGSWPQRHRIAVRDTHLTDPAAMAEIAERLRAGQSVLVVANNVADARTLYGQLASHAREPEEALLLHSRFRREDRSAIEAAVRSRFGTHQPRQPGLLVATQVVEVSLDVDFDVLHTSGAPLDALLQRFGRVNRVGARPPAPVVVHQPSYRPRRGSGQVEYADGVYEAEPTRLAMDLLARHDGHVVDEREVLGWLNQIYRSDWGTEWRQEVQRFHDQFAEAFLSFKLPFDDRSCLAEKFDELFDGAEAVLADDRDKYAKKLLSARTAAAGRLLAEELLIPVPFYAAARCHWDRQLRVRILDAEYNSRDGLIALRGTAKEAYRAGEIV